MILETKRLGQRREQRTSIDLTMDLNPSPPPRSQVGMFQESYVLSATLKCTFWANRAQLDRARDRAKRALMHHIYKDALDILVEMEVAVEEMDQDQLRRACLDMRDIFTGSNEE